MIWCILFAMLQIEDGKEFSTRYSINMNKQHIESVERQLKRLQRSHAKLLLKVNEHHRGAGKPGTIRPRRSRVPTRMRTWELELPFKAFWEKEE